MFRKRRDEGLIDYGKDEASDGSAKSGSLLRLNNLLTLAPIRGINPESIRPSRPRLPFFGISPVDHLRFFFHHFDFQPPFPAGTLQAPLGIMGAAFSR